MKLLQTPKYQKNNDKQMPNKCLQMSEGNCHKIGEQKLHETGETPIIGFLRGGVIPLIFPKVPQSSQTESVGFPRERP